jgi:hypothetical protein
MWTKSYQINNLLDNTGVPRGGVWGVQTPPKFRSFEKAWPNSQFHGIYICNNLIRIRVLLIYKLSETRTRGLLHPYPRYVCPMSSAEFFEPPPPRKKILGTLLLDNIRVCRTKKKNHVNMKYKFKPLIQIQSQSKTR